MIRVGDHKELQAAVLAMKAADKDLRRAINTSTRETMNPTWKALVDVESGTLPRMGGRVLAAGTRVAAGNPVVLLAASSKRGIGDGKRVVPADLYAAWEFGVGSTEAYSKYERTSKNGTRHTVTRRTMRHLPRRNRQGHAVYQASAEFIPRAISLWLHIIVKKYAEAAEGKQV